MSTSDPLMYPYCEQLDDSSFANSYYIHFIISTLAVLVSALLIFSAGTVLVSLSVLLKFEGNNVHDVFELLMRYTVTLLALCQQRRGFSHINIFVWSGLSISETKGDSLEGSSSEPQKKVFWVGCGLLLASKVFVRLERLHAQTGVKTPRAYMYIWLGELMSPPSPRSLNNTLTPSTLIWAKRALITSEDFDVCASKTLPEFLGLQFIFLTLKGPLQLLIRVHLSPLQIDISKCHYLVDLDTMRETPREPKYSSNREEWINLAYRPFLDASRYVALILSNVLGLIRKKVGIWDWITSSPGLTLVSILFYLCPVPWEI